MNSLSPMVKNSLIILAAFVVSTGLTFAVSSTSSGAFLKSKPYTTYNTYTESELAKYPEIIGLIDTIVLNPLKEKAKAKVGAEAYVAYVDNYLAKVDNLDNLYKNDRDYDRTITHLFKYIYPRAVALKQVPTLSLSINGNPVSNAQTISLTNGTGLFVWSNTGATSCVLNETKNVPASGSEVLKDLAS